MVDTCSPELRSRVMAAVPSRNTRPEIRVRSLLHRMGYRFTVNGPLNRSLPGRPDVVLPRFKTAVFVHGCFWHGHKGCPNFRMPKTRSKWWRNKFDSNIRRDKKNIRLLSKDGWNPIVIWECETLRPADLETLAARLRQELSETPHLTTTSNPENPKRQRSYDR